MDAPNDKTTGSVGPQPAPATLETPTDTRTSPPSLETTAGGSQLHPEHEKGGNPLGPEQVVVEDEASAPRDLGSGGTPKDAEHTYGFWHRLLTPKSCRWHADFPSTLRMPLNFLYAISTTFTVANLYYNQPILNRIADDFNVTYEESSQVATLMQAGYAGGLIFILPFGDMVKRRLFIISLVLATATLWIALCVTHSFTTFRAISFICGAMTVTPQLMIPLVGDYAPPHRRAAFLSVVVSGLLLGMLVARLLSGVVTNFTSWRNVYWFACGAQYLLGCLLFAFMPDYPATNPDGLSYIRALASIPRMVVTEPVLLQACCVALCLSGVFTAFWTTLTFLLASPPYEYSSLVIGLFSLLGIVAMCSVPVFGRYIDRFVPLFSIVLGACVVLIAVIIGTSIGTFTVAGPIIQAIGIDVGSQCAQVANRSAIFKINPKARNRVNTAYMAFAFAGQLMGTSVGNRLYAEGGWTWSGGFAIALAGTSIVFALARGPRETRWLGWRGGWRPRIDGLPNARAPQSEPAAGEQGVHSKDEKSS